MNKNSGAYSANIFGDIFKNILFFPVWWYSLGLLGLIARLKDFVVDREKGLALFIWIKNIFVPMYGQRDAQGVIISICVRIVQIIFRSALMVFWLFFALIVFWLWVIAPILIIYQIIWQLN